MDCRTGEILHADSKEHMEALMEEKGKLLSLSLRDERQLRPMNPAKRKNSMRNRKCPCGSGAKFKKCCWGTYI